MVPGFWDPKRRPDRPDVTRLPTQIRFVSTEDYPPFSFRGEDGRPAGFNVDIARAICTELAIRCTLEIMPFEALAEALASGKADAAIAGIAITPATRETLDFSDRYFRSPARFVARRGEGELKVTPDALASKTVGVIGGTAHEAYLHDFFGEIAVRAFPDPDAARAALRKGEVDLIFGDGVQLALWLNGSSSENCCAFVGGPFTESLYFGEGMGIAVKRGNDALRQSLNYALAQLWEEGVYTDLYLRWFPISVY
ncbi:transporter substrate-binding domain-containing protein [Ancylobacter sp. TS-1]|nr:transporter substrate-binding domain-containing protein [Ancylobacter sp. TS-1]